MELCKFSRETDVVFRAVFKLQTVATLVSISVSRLRCWLVLEEMSVKE